MLSVLTIWFLLSSCNTTIDVRVDPYVHGIDEDGIAFIVNHDSHFVEVQSEEWEKEFVSLHVNNLADIIAEISQHTSKDKKLVKSLKTMRDNYYWRKDKSEKNKLLGKFLGN